MKPLLLLSLLSVLVGCDVVGTVIDISGSETQVRNLRLSGPGTLQVISLGSVKLVPLESFESITLFTEEAQTVNGEFCFAADIYMRDGARLAARDKTHDNSPQTFIAVNQTLLGTSHRGSFSADLTGVSKITFLHRGRF